MSCKTKNVIYSIICAKCKKFYIGQTKNELRKRMTLHRQQTSTEELRFMKVNKHFHECSNGKFNIFPLYKVLEDKQSLRDEKEIHFIRSLKPHLNGQMFIAN